MAAGVEGQEKNSHFHKKIACGMHYMHLCTYGHITFFLIQDEKNLLALLNRIPSNIPFGEKIDSSEHFLRL